MRLDPGVATIVADMLTYLMSITLPLESVNNQRLREIESELDQGF